MSQKYTSPLTWNKRWGPDEDGDVSYSASTPFGQYTVEKYDGRWLWRYCFDEYYDEDKADCDSLKDGKRLAQEHWDERVQDVLKTRKEVRPIERREV